MYSFCETVKKVGFTVILTYISMCYILIVKCYELIQDIRRIFIVSIDTCISLG